MAERRDLLVRFDWALRRLLRQQDNWDILEGFLTVFLGQPVQIVEILKGQEDLQSERDEYNRVDIKAKDAKGEIILIEVQNTREMFYLARTLRDVSKNLTELIEMGQPYGDIQKVYSISILYFDWGKGSDYLYKGQNRFVGVHTQDSLEITPKQLEALVGKKPEGTEYILIRLNQFDREPYSPLEEWMAYLKDGVIRPETMAPGLQEAREKLRYYWLSDRDRYAYDAHVDAILVQDDMLSTARLEGYYEGLEMGRAEARAIEAEYAESREIGRLQAKRSIVRNLKAMGMDPELISEVSGLTLEEIDQI